MFVRRYLIPRLIQYVLVILLGITAVFFIPRLLPNDPVLRTVAELRARGSTLEPGAVDKIIADLTEMYGLEGSMGEQYWAFWGRLLRGDLIFGCGGLKLFELEFHLVDQAARSF